MKNQKGVLGLCDKNKGNALPDELIKELVDFYESDNNSQMCPGMKDCNCL